MSNIVLTDATGEIIPSAEDLAKKKEKEIRYALHRTLKIFANTYLPELVEECRIHSINKMSCDPECCLSDFVARWFLDGPDI